MVSVAAMAWAQSPQPDPAAPRPDTAAADLAAAIKAAGLDPEHCYLVRDLSLPKDDIKLYFNGRLDRRLPGTMGSDDGDYQLLVGELRFGERQFEGSLDEIAVYLRELTPTEIQSHYILLDPSGRRGS